MKKTLLFLFSALMMVGFIGCKKDKESEPEKQSETGGGGNQTATYYIKHPWGTGADEAWEWRIMSKEGSNYTYTGAWGGVGANINTTPDDNGASWFAASSISGASDLTIGASAKFVYNPSDSSLYVTANGGGQPATTSFYIKHPWGGNDWTWQPMTTSGSNYTYTGVWGGVGANINTSADDSGAEWYEKSKINGASSVSEGETVTFTFVSSNGAVGFLSVSKNGGGTTSKPSAPTNVSASASSSYIEVTWSSVNKADSYNVYRATSASGNYSYRGNTSYTYYTDYSVTAGTTYYYKVTAQNSAGESSMSSYASAKVTSSGGGGGGGQGGGGGTTTNYEPCPPSVSCTGTSSVTVKWNASTGSGCGTPTSYTVKRTNRVTGKADVLKESTSSTSYTDSQPFPGINVYGVSATNNYGTSSSGTAISSSIGIKAPEFADAAGMSGNSHVVYVDVNGLNVPDEWKPYYKLELYWSTTYSGTYIAQASWNYSDYTLVLGDNSFCYTYDFGDVNFGGKTYYYKLRWVFEAPYSPSKVEGSFTSVKTVNHRN